MDKEQHDWGVPDWRDASAYPDDLTDEQWRWEFLRRRDDYRNDWLAHRDNTQGDSIPFLAYWFGATEKYGLWGDCLLNPALSAKKLTEGEPHFATTSGPTEDSLTNVIPPENSNAAFRYQFDLKKSIEPQLRAAEQAIKGELTALEWEAEMGFGGRVKAHASRAHRSKYRTYLRVLDARADKVTFEAIGREVLGIKVEAINSNDAAARAKQIHEVAMKLSFKP